MREHVVTGGGGVKLHVRDWGPQDGPAIVLIHGWSQHHLCWSRQIDSPLLDAFRLVAMDLRGHGQSEAPKAPESYTTGALWADDVAAVLRSLELARPVLVGWSYGGLVIGDYLRRFGDEAIAGVDLVCAAVGIGPAWFGALIGADFVEQAPLASSEDPAVALKAMQTLLHRCFVRPIDAADMELAMGWSVLAPPHVRASLIRRDEDFRPELGRLRKPLLVTCGGADTIVLPAMARAIQDSCPGCRVSEYDGVGHAPFLEDPLRFNAELAEFARRCSRA